MRLVWVTDTHLEFPGDTGRLEFAKLIKAQKPDRVLITGDIANAADIEWILPELQEEIGSEVIFVLGNHDFYHGDIFSVREWAKGPWMHMKYAHGQLIELNRSACIVGVDGWADAQHGRPRTSNVGLADWQFIEDMNRAGCAHSRAKRIRMLSNLGKEEAQTLERPLAQALAQYDRVFVMTHVPPWVEATWHEGFHSEPDWLPWFSCKAVGDCIEKLSAQNPGKKITVLCGHTHGYGYSKISDDIEVFTGMATYYVPEIQFVINLFEDGSFDRETPKNSWQVSSQ